MEAGLRAYLREFVPLSTAMEVSVEIASPARVLLGAPLAPNVNHMGTAFGGSIQTLAILAGWSWLWVLLNERSPLPELVIARAETDYLRPIQGDFTAEMRPPDEGEIGRFIEVLNRRGRSRIDLSVEVLGDGEVAARFLGSYVAFAR